MNQSSKPRRAVLVSVEKESGGLRIRLDDVMREFAVDTWVQKDHFTNKLVPEDAFERMAFDDKELADFGYSILARLSAFVKRNEC
ncbi:MAG TPA: hypothetical protein VN957_19845 [Chthoniobacterales bacterium]|nr:hypothetical protein [Chthoniobacterales bacterium]